MKKLELTLIVIWTTFFLLKGVEYTGSATFFVLATAILCLYYLFGSTRIFKTEPSSPKTIPLIAGIALSTSLITIPFTINLRNWDWLQILPIINILFTSFLLGYWLVKKIKKKPSPNFYSNILIRASIILLITCFFAYRSTGSSLYRNTIIFLNAGNDDLISNMRMFQYAEKTDELLEKGDCDEAIKYTLKALKEGEKWLWIDSDTLTESDITQLWKIHGTYTDIYKAYQCKAQKLEDESDYEKAIGYLLKADSFLNIIPTEKFERWRMERAGSKNKIGLCYDNLNQNDSAVSYFTKAASYYIENVGYKDSNLATYMFNLGHVLGEQRYFTEANQLLNGSINILKQDTSTQDNLKDIGRAYLRLAYNGLASNNLDFVKTNLDNSIEYLTPRFNCEFQLYSSAYKSNIYQYDSAIEYASKALKCYSNEYSQDNQNVAECYGLLFEAWMSKPNFDSAIVNLQKGIKITSSNYSQSSVKFHYYIERKARYLYSIGDYQKSKELLNKVLKVYKQRLGDNDGKLTAVLATLARNNIELLNFKEANKQIKECIRVGNYNAFFGESSSSDLLNNIAYIKYAIGSTHSADSIYRKVLELNSKDGKDTSPSIAESLNGMGLIEMSKENYHKADSLFKASIKMYNQYYPNNCPSRAIVQMNLGKLKLMTNKRNEAKNLLNSALNGFKQFHRNNHPTVGDILLLIAELRIKEKEFAEATDLLNKALEIFEQNFDQDNLKIKQTKNKLRTINNV